VTQTQEARTRSSDRDTDRSSDRTKAVSAFVAPHRTIHLVWSKDPARDYANLFFHKLGRPECYARFYPAWKRQEGHSAGSYLVRDVKRILRCVDWSRYRMEIRDTTRSDSKFYDVNLDFFQIQDLTSLSSPCDQPSAAQKFEDMGWRMPMSERGS